MMHKQDGVPTYPTSKEAPSLAGTTSWVIATEAITATSVTTISSSPMKYLSRMTNQFFGLTLRMEPRAQEPTPGIFDKAETSRAGSGCYATGPFHPAKGSPK
eukprot:131701-Heterocapsa_arctica.AAC.1